jgi:TonB family protein
MVLKLLLCLKLYLLRVLYFVLDKLSDIPRFNRCIIKQKVYIGASIISLSLLITATCNSQVSTNKTKLKDSFSKADTISEIINDTNVMCYAMVEQMPEYPGGTEFLKLFIQKNIQYPIEALKKGIHGRVYISFIVTETGKISDPKIMRSLYPSLDAEAIRILKLMPNWKPGKQNGLPVKTSMSLPINFLLPD